MSRPVCVVERKVLRVHVCGCYDLFVLIPLSMSVFPPGPPHFLHTVYTHYIAPNVCLLVPGAADRLTSHIHYYIYIYLQ